MALPNLNPDEHGEEITGLTAEQRRAELDALAEHAAELEGTAAQRLADQLAEPVVPDGGTVGRSLAPHVSRATKVRDGLRVWAPGLLTTAAFITAAIVFPLPGPLFVYGLGLAGFGWWMAAGRPGPADSIRIVFYTLSDFAAWVKKHVTRLAVRRGTYEARRTATPAPAQKSA
ncbi:hypothetical protein IU450_38625 [Nocardia abscessus]|uniref:hypothetical protein n=1 Tax=Nocardia abscessus TaxID=120957 RepID=UPI001894DC44|nr:hypothetical protein [Nocardia abscessus]MBF6341752.1 hypothetical protein [Nocardia abscessus]